MEWLESLCTRFLLRILFPRGIVYHPGQIEVLERCSKSRAPFLFLPVHKSPLGYFSFAPQIFASRNFEGAKMAVGKI